jgi:hypothetical protein
MFRCNTTHHRYAVGEFIFLFEGMTFWGEIIDLYLLRVDFSLFFAFGSRPLRRIGILSHTKYWVSGNEPTRSWRGMAAFSGGINML